MAYITPDNRPSPIRYDRYDYTTDEGARYYEHQGGTCEFDLPGYYAWQHHPAEARRADLERWAGTLAPLAESIHLLLRLLEALSGQVSLAIERENLSRQAQVARLQIEAEQMRNALLSSVSHDLRTPLTVIAGSASSLLDSPMKYAVL